MSTVSEKIRGLADTVRRGIERFPLTVVFALALTVCAMILEYRGYNGVSDKWRFFMIWYPATGIALSLSLSLWLEEHAGKTGYIISAALIHILWVGVSVMLMHNYRMLGYAPYSYFMAAIIVVLILSLLVLSFTNDKNDVAFWNFSLRSTGGVVTAVIVSGIVCGGLELLIVAIEKLFGVFISSHCYSNVAIICFFLLAPILVIQSVPGGALKHDNEPMIMSRLIENAVTRLFMPIVAAYLITLYCYAAKILFTWQLPDGWVSWLVSASMMAMVLLIIMVYPYRDKASQSSSSWNRMAVQFITRRMPILMLPLLVLMSIGIIKRVSDYGITVLRVYLIIFNLWCYTVCIIHLLLKEARIKWIPVSFVVVFAATTVLPLNVSSCVKRSLLDKVNIILNDSGWNGPAMNNEQYKEWLDSLEPEKAVKADSWICYLKQQFSNRTVSSIIEDGVLTGSRTGTTQVNETDSILLEMDCYRNILENVDFPIPENVSSIRMVRGTFDIKPQDYKEGILTVTMHFEQDNTDREKEYYTFRFPIGELEALKGNATDRIHSEGYAIRHTGIRQGSPETKAYLYLNTFWVRLDSKEDGHFGISGLLFK